MNRSRSVRRNPRPGSARRGLVERVAAGAGAAGVRVVDGEALLLDGVNEVDDRTLQVRGAHPVDAHAQPLEVAEQVAVELAVVEEQLVAQAGTASGLHGDAQVHVVTTLLLEQGAGLDGGGVGELDAVCLLRHRGGFDGVVDGHGTPNDARTGMCSPALSLSMIGPRTDGTPRPRPGDAEHVTPLSGS